jgi:hypothetical protein
MIHKPRTIMETCQSKTALACSDPRSDGPHARMGADYNLAERTQCQSASLISSPRLRPLREALSKANLWRILGTEPFR